ncbi:MAG TPA: hypothetical protein VFN67_41505 [Polyangiales bacterium]|nr:hypothetical protein [Polyangiales bacterium]
MNDSARADNDGSQPKAAESESAASEVQSALAHQRIEEKLRAVANHLERIATAYIDSLHSESNTTGDARR